MRGHIRRRGPDRWQLIVSAGFDPVTGRRRQVFGSAQGTRDDAEQALARLVVEVGAGHHLGPTSTLDELFEAWVTMDDLEPSTAYQARRRYERYVKSRLGHVQVRRLQVVQLDMLYRDLQRAGGVGGAALSASTVRRVHTDLSAVLSKAVRWQWIVANPAALASPPKVRAGRPKAPTPAELRRLFEVGLDHDPDLVEFLRLAATTGARRGEVCALRWPHVDVERGGVRITRALGHRDGGVYEKDTKSGDERWVSLDDVTMAMLAARRRRAIAEAQQADVWLAADAFVFSYRTDGTTGWQPSGVSHRFDRLRKRAGLEHVQLRQLRHFVGTYLGDAGLPVGAISGRLGHSRKSTTLDFYTAHLVEPDRRAAEVLGRLLDGAAQEPGSGAG